MKKLITTMGVAALLCLQFNCSSSDNNGSGGSTPVTPVTPVTNEVAFYLTKGDESVKLALQNTVLGFGTTANDYNTIEVTDTGYQTVDGFGFTMTGGSAEVINNLTDAKQGELLQDLFSTTNGIGISYLRLSIGASDLNEAPFSYDDMPSGQTDPTLANFSLANDATLIAVLKKVLAINPNIKIIAAPWSAPVWMKTNSSFSGGSLQTQYYDEYAQYFVKYIQGMAAEGISITAVTPQNEPLNANNNPSLVMQANEQNNFIKNALGPAFRTAGLDTKIVVYDHNCDVTSFATTILSDNTTSQYVDGSAWHLYGGDISALGTVHNAFPSKNVYFTEFYTSSTGSFSDDLKDHVKRVIVGSMRNWSKNALEWNLANNGSFGPHTQGGCGVCKGAITVTSTSTYDKNVGYYIVAHASKFVPAGSVRLSSTANESLNNVAFKTPDGKHVLIVENDAAFALTYNIKYNGQWFTTKLDGNSVATYVW